MDSFEGRLAVVTGGGTGMGRELVIQLAAAGCSVATCDINAENMSATARRAGKDAPPDVRITTHVADVSDETQMNRFRDEVVAEQQTDHVDLLFNNAGIGAPAMPLEDLPYETWKQVVDTNLTGMFLCTQEAIKIMKAQDPRGGRIINNGSISAHAPRPRSVAYTATKHAVTGLTKSTALDCRGYDITCGQIDIGNAATPLTDRMVQGQGVMQADGRMAVEPRMNVDDVGRAVVYMASLPLDTNVLFMTVMANLMPFVGRG